MENGQPISLRWLGASPGAALFSLADCPGTHLRMLPVSMLKLQLQSSLGRNHVTFWGLEIVFGVIFSYFRGMKDLAYRAGAILGLLGIALGAFGAHALHDRLVTLDSVAIYETAARYQMYHALFLLGVGILSEFGNSNWLRRATVFALVGVLIFSGCLYSLSLTRIGIFGAITPIGGASLLIAWACLFVHLYQRKKNT